MKYNELNAPKQKLGKRVGRGISAGGGKTAGRGTKGQGARKSPGKAGFEGGQMPIYMRLPKLRGFKQFRPAKEVIYTSQLDGIKATVIDNAVLAEAGLVSNAFVSTKLISKGEFKSKKTVKLQSASASAIKAIETNGGSFTETSQVGRPSKKDNKTK